MGENGKDVRRPWYATPKMRFASQIIVIVTKSPAQQAKHIKVYAK